MKTRLSKLALRVSEFFWDLYLRLTVRPVSKRVARRALEMARARDVEIDAYVAGSQGVGIQGAGGGDGLYLPWAGARGDNQTIPSGPGSEMGALE